MDEGQPQPTPLDDALSNAELWDTVYAALRDVAERFFRVESAGHTLQPTALISEAYMKLASQRERAQNPDQLVGLAAIAMRRVLVDHARKRGAAKRTMTEDYRLLTEDNANAGAELTDLLAIDEALTALERGFPRAARVVELRFFGGMEMAQVAALLGVSKRTAEYDWRFARAFLRRQMSAVGEQSDDTPGNKAGPESNDNTAGGTGDGA